MLIETYPYKGHTFFVPLDQDFEKTKAGLVALFEKYVEILKINNVWTYQEGTIDWQEFILLTETERSEAVRLLLGLGILKLSRENSWAIFTGSTCLCPTHPASAQTLYFGGSEHAIGFASIEYRGSAFDWCIVEQGKVIMRSGLKLFHEPPEISQA